MKKVVIFVHGLGGSAESTWKKLYDVVKDDPDLNYEYSFFEYSTQMVRLPLFLQKEYRSIQDLAKELKTFINNNHEDADEIVLIGHSLGGLIIRKYLLDETISGHKIKIKKILFYAVPHKGSKWADLSDKVSIKHRHLKQLCKNSEFLDVMDKQWSMAKMDILFDIHCVVGELDEIVSAESSTDFCRKHTYDLVSKGHLNIVEPIDKNDPSLKILRDFLLKKSLIRYANINGMLTYKEWAGFDDFQNFEFIPEEERIKALYELRELLQEPKQCARIIGLSGLGKTRLALEVFRYELEENNEIQSQVGYIDISGNSENWPTIIADLAIKGYKGILVIDNCDLPTHSIIKEKIQHSNCNLSLLTLDYNLKEASDTHNIRLNKLHDDTIKQMLEPLYLDSIPDLSRIISFSQGFPRIAVLLIQARINQLSEAEMGSLTDEYLLSKLLWGGATPNTIDIKVLRACSLFDKFGIVDDVSEEFNFIIENICGESIDDAYECLNVYRERGIIDERGRFAQVVPKPLAVTLAAEWMKNTHPDRQIELITGEMPGELSIAFCDQMRYLYFVSEAKSLVKDICGETSPFGQAEVILSKLGSRLFRSLVEVNPEVTLNTLYRVIYPLSKDELLKVEGDVRRNLVWSLEKLSFKNSEFENAVRLLLKLAVAENESWSNNATGQFIQLFQTFLSGTEASPEKRLVIIDEIIKSKDQEQIYIAIKALEGAISIYNNTRMVGAEQGNRKPLEDWKPRIWQEAFDYWDNAIDRLLIIADEYKALKDHVKMAISNNIRNLVSYNRLDKIDEALHFFVKNDGKFWPEALESIKDTISFDSENIPQESLSKLKDWINLLTPDDIVNRLKLIVSVPPHTYNNDEEGNYIDEAKIEAEKLAEELAEQPEILLENIQLLLQDEQRQVRNFGRVYAEKSDVLIELIVQGFKILPELENPNPGLLIAMMDVLKNKNKEEWDNFIQLVAFDINLARFLPRFLQSSKPSLEELKIIVESIKVGYLDITSLQYFSTGQSLSHLTSDEIIEFCNQLMSSCATDEVPWIILDILFMYTHHSDEKPFELIEIYKNVLLKIRFENVDKRVRDYYHFEKGIKQIDSYENDENFIVKISESIFSQAFSQDYNTASHLKKIIHYLVKKHGNLLWPIIFKKIEELTYPEVFRLEQILGHRNGFHETPSLIDSLPDEKILSLCKNNENSIKVLIKSMKTIEENEGEWQFTPIARKMINKFGDHKETLHAISANLFSFSWSGSAIPYYKNIESAFEKLSLDSKLNVNVQKWITEELQHVRHSIKHETQRDEEESF